MSLNFSHGDTLKYMKYDGLFTAKEVADMQKTLTAVFGAEPQTITLHGSFQDTHGEPIFAHHGRGIKILHMGIKWFTGLVDGQEVLLKLHDDEYASVMFEWRSY